MAYMPSGIELIGPVAHTRYVPRPEVGDSDIGNTVVIGDIYTSTSQYDRIDIDDARSQMNP